MKTDKNEILVDYGMKVDSLLQQYREKQYREDAESSKKRLLGLNLRALLI